MSNERVRTRICTPSGELEFQTYFVKRRARDRVTAMRFEGASEAAPAPGLLDAIANAEAIILCPSNPFISIGPILAIPGIRDSLAAQARQCGRDFAHRGRPRAQRSRRENDEEHATAIVGGRGREALRGFLRRLRAGRSGSQASRASGSGSTCAPSSPTPSCAGCANEKLWREWSSANWGSELDLRHPAREEPAKRQAALDGISCRRAAGNSGSHALPADVGRAVSGRGHRSRGGRHQRCRDRRTRAQLRRAGL